MSCFALAKKVGEGKVGGGAVHMAAALAGYRLAFVSTGWTISHLVSTNSLRNRSSPNATFPDLWAVFSQVGCSLVREP